MSKNKILKNVRKTSRIKSLKNVKKKKSEKCQK